jgi:hypothetical protein
MPLRHNALNVVGENHPESNARRALERLFAEEKTGSPDYWTENEFPDGGADDAEGADLMEFRAAHATALLIKNFGKFCDEASRVGAITDGTAGAAITGFVMGNLDTFNTYKQRTRNSWKPTQTAEVNKAAQDVYDQIDDSLQKYRQFMNNAVVQSQIDKQLQGTRALGNERAKVTILLPALLKSVGADESADADVLEKEMRKQRSSFMGFGAAKSARKGVWKVGNEHIADLKSGAAKVRNTTANFITRDDFNQEFDTWKKVKGYA